MDVFGGAVLFSSLAVALWKCGLAFLSKPSRGRPYAISSVSFLLLALLFVAAYILSPPPDRAAWIFAAVTSVHALGYPRTLTLAAAFLAAASISEIANTDHSETAAASDILCLCGALIATIGSIPAFFSSLAPPAKKTEDAPPATRANPAKLFSISTRPLIQLKSD